MDYDTHIQLSFDLLELYADIERELLMNVGRYIAKYKLTVDNVASWQLDNLMQVGNLNTKQLEIIRKSARISRKNLVEMLTDAGYRGADKYESTFEEAYKQGLVKLKPVSTDNSVRILKILDEYIKQASDVMNLVNTTMLKSSKDMFLKAVNSIATQVSIGLKTPQQAIIDTLKKESVKGLPVFTDKLGREWSSEAYINMITRTMNSNISNAMEDARREEYGIHYIEVSSHMGARPKCAPYQGRIFYTGEGQDPLGKYPRLSDTSYGDPAGLFGINCGHHKYPYVPGLNISTYKPYDSSENSSIYEARQQQRKLEREVRQYKRERALMMGVKDQDGVKLAEYKISSKQKEIREHISKHNLTRRYDREKPIKSNFSDVKLNKMVYNNKKLRDEYNNMVSNIGKSAPQKVENLYDMKYNDKINYKTLKEYEYSRKNSNISSFSTFSDYKNYKLKLDEEIVGLVTSNGIRIKSYSKHAIDRVLGTSEDPKTRRPRSGVKINEIREAILNGSLKESSYDKTAIVFYGKYARVTVNKLTGNIIQVNPLSSERKK